MAGNTTINTDDRQHGTMLERIGRRAMLERGLLPDFTLPVMADLDAIQISAAPAAQSG